MLSQAMRGSDQPAQASHLCFGRRKINLSLVFAGQAVGVREVTDHIWLISFMHYDPGCFDDQCTRVQCDPNKESAGYHGSARGLIKHDLRYTQSSRWQGGGLVATGKCPEHWRRAPRGNVNN